MITIVTPAYNAEHYLPATIDSVVAQTCKDWEYVIVDDGSSDGTAEIARKWEQSDPRIRLVRKTNGGVCSARNRGLREACGASRYITFLDNDDLWETNALATLLEAIEARPQAAAAYGLARWIDENGCLVEPGGLEYYQRDRYAVQSGKMVKWPVERPTVFEVEAVSEAVITPGTVLIRRSALAAAGDWAEELTIWEDWDLWLRLTRVGEMAFVNRHVLNYRLHGDNVSADTEKLEKGERAVRKRLLDSLSSSPDLLEIAVLGAQFHQRRIIGRRLGWAADNLKKANLLGCAKQLRHAMLAYRQGPVRPER